MLGALMVGVLSWGVSPPSVTDCRIVASDLASGNSSLTFPRLSRASAGAVLFGRTDAQGVSSLVRATLGGARTLIASTLDAVPGEHNCSFAALDGAADSPAGVVFRAHGDTPAGSLVPSFVGVYSGQSPNHVAVAETGVPMPSAPAGYAFGGFGVPAIADDGAVVFVANNESSKKAGGSGKWRGIYQQQADTRKLVKIVDTADVHPVTGGKFTTIDSPSIDRAAQSIAFFASSPARGGGGGFADGLYAAMLLPEPGPEERRRLVVVAEEGDPIPGFVPASLERFADFTVPVADATNASVVGFVGSDTGGGEGVYVGVLDVASVRAVEVRKVAFAGNGVVTKVLGADGAEQSVQFLSFGQPPSVHAAARQVMFGAAADPPNATGIYLAIDWGATIFQVATLMPPPPGVEACDGTDAGFISLGIRDNSFGGDSSRFTYFGTSSHNSTIFTSEIKFSLPHRVA